MSDLERRYRRLLALYPRDHRERRGEEMLAVLLESADPGWRESADLVRGALRLHLRRVFALDGGVDPRDVLAVVSLLAPVAVLAGATTAVHEVAWWVRNDALGDLSWTQQVPDAPVWAIWLLTAVLSAFGLRRAAAAGAWLGAIGFLVLSVNPHWIPAPHAGSTLLGLLTAISLTWSPGPRSGRERVGGAAVPIVAAAVVAHVAVGTLAHGSPSVEFVELAVLAVGALFACGAGSRVGRRAALVLVVPVATALLTAVVQDVSGRLPDIAQYALLYGLPLVVLVLLGAMPRSVKRRTGR
ncbi:hypothetical protein [Actinokineospora spheciospongiae]|uniref:hypothetical protein n=1 Tax=Actinokineospora spheciospongiae TaxID=909613 RepID=UPI000D7137BE|nr:hypothetical protein [Actinokineospora spheciospongiae]PWW56952.1 hypothetical protein DFQ13_110154 [Actinokineospora spheciospongiae]